MKLAALSQKVVVQLMQKELTLATAESCTGGLIAKLITDVSGSSNIFIGGVVSYSNAMKQKWLGVKSETIEKFGAVSEATVSEMLSGVRVATGCDLAIAVSGVAGPTGGTPDKPIGTVVIGWRFREKEIMERFQFNGTREEIRNSSAEFALLKVIELID
jgi:PncC family amidohydrolase